MSNPHITSTTSTARSNQPRRKWFINLQMDRQERALNAAAAAASTALAATTDGSMATTANNELNLIPVGFSNTRVQDKVTPEDDDRLLARRSWDIALQPIKQLPMMMIFSWMAGNSFSLMSIMIVGTLFMKPIQSVFSLGSAFASLEQEGVGGNIWLLKIVYLLGSLAHLGLALYKCQSMGLLPTYNSDWIAFADQQTQMEMTVGGFAYH